MSQDITLSREHAQAALDALNFVQTTRRWGDEAGASTALRSALAQPAEIPSVQPAQQEALRALVACKDTEDRLHALHEMGHGTDWDQHRRQFAAAWLAARAALAAAPAATQPEGQEAAKLANDVFFLIGVAFGPYLHGLTELPVGILEVAERIAAGAGDRAMEKRCRELADKVKADSARSAQAGGGKS